MTGDDTFPGPWVAEVRAAGMNDLSTVWNKWTSERGLLEAIDHYKRSWNVDVDTNQVKQFLGEVLNVRKLELLDPAPAPNPNRTQSTKERVDAAIMEHLSATDAYAVAVELSARLDAESKRQSSRKYLEVKAAVPEGQKRVTDTEANRAVDADEGVLEARLAADIALASAKAAKARLDHWEHVIEWGRSVYSRETRADTR